MVFKSHIFQKAQTFIKNNPNVIKIVKMTTRLSDYWVVGLLGHCRTTLMARKKREGTFIYFGILRDPPAPYFDPPPGLFFL